ncbi:quinoprotein dehydrogenase-associated SoxYZ-like carrier [Aurantimonas sp. VKM B-3413]|uniref:quinoprotein dehydrogenase-associated SoxYZ-like carrier n=1 Tax=Aurantimonas sp. VKM B-3413 TaxID=2779401 RepID=UPI001E3FDFA2|nr:quinoprotein dehydrogenase-associated SoxYZ-like carrier [Aurantimonas sp. VKM B-3413]MCB8838260.1 quinoprotein dehydrogenase-associated SoxYZ-like carrier [Aurantimonas sp. VKM B-3413]
MSANRLRPLARSAMNSVTAAIVLAALAAAPALAENKTMTADQAAAAADSAWPGLKSDLFGERPLVEGSDAIALDAPHRASDPAIVPIKLTLDPNKDIRKVTLVIDENPSPVAATFDIAPGSGLSQLSTRVRVNAYTDIHAIAEAADGTLYMTKKFVKAAGGCAAPAAKDPELAAREMGQMKLREFDTGKAGSHEAQLMIRHPNNSGLQKDQVTLLYIPAHFITDLEVDKGGKLLFSMQGGISISEDPSFRFHYQGDVTGPFHAKASDTEGKVFERTFDGGQS